MRREIGEGEVIVMAIGIFMLIAGICALVGALGMANLMYGNYMQALPMLLMPAILAYWAFNFSEDVRRDPLLAILTTSWIGGMALGFIAAAVRQWFA